METNSLENRVRIDKWLWFARQAKTRSLAQKLIVSGKVRINRDKITSAAKLVGPDDVITLTLPRDIKILKVIECGKKRGPFSQAQFLYEDLSPPKTEKKINSILNTEPVANKRPDKRARRQAQILSGRIS